MLIDWFTVGAQLVNFLILVVVLKFVLYDRVVAAMDARQQRIAEQVQRAEEREAEAAREAARHRAELEQLERDRADRMHEAEGAADRRRQELVARARRDAAELADRWRQAVDDQRERLLVQLRDGAATRVLAITRQVLADLADEELEDRIVTVFVHRLDDAEAARLPTTSPDHVEVHTAFPLEGDRRDRVEAAVRAHVGEVTRVVRDPDLVGGIEVHVDGHALGWNVATYLDELDEALKELLHAEASTA